MKKLPLGIQTFKEIVSGNYVYVDKTQYVYRLINDGKNYFLSRPRRFGKSLLLDTIAEAFSGEKELFKGLWIYDSDYEFVKHPVIRFDMSNIPNETSKILKDSISEDLLSYAAKHSFNLVGNEPAILFRRLIENLYEKYNQKVAVLIDEYDKPILDHITDLETANANRDVLRGFYGILKSMDRNLKLTFITGVSKFTKTSIFSGMNHLTDLTMKKKYANICGIPVDSLEEYFGEHLEDLKTHKRFMQCDCVLDKILEWYDGYSWDGETKLLNPFSLLSFFRTKKFSGFWYSSGSPRFLLDLIKTKPESYTNIEDTKISEDMLDSVEIDKITIEPLLFQTGYLTVKELQYTSDDLLYHLKIPNQEVRRAFNMHILASLTENDDVKTGRVRMEILESLKAGDLNNVLEILRGFFALIPYNLHVDLEAYYHSIFYTFMNVLGLDMDVEVNVAKGRVDATLELHDKVYVMEFKYKKCPPEASEEDKQRLFEEALAEGMEQIKDRGYGEKYRGSGKAVFEAAFAFLGRGDIEMRIA